MNLHNWVIVAGAAAVMVVVAIGTGLRLGFVRRQQSIAVPESDEAQKNWCALHAEGGR